MGRGGNAIESNFVESPSKPRLRKFNFLNDPIPDFPKRELSDYRNQILSEYQQLNEQEMDNLVKELQPKGSSDNGFLAKNESLLEIVEQDLSDLETIGVTPQELGIKLFNISQAVFPFVRSKYSKLAENDIPEHLEIAGGAAYRGWQSCPFIKQGLCHCHKKDNNQIISMHSSSRLETVIGNLNFQITNKRIKERIKVSGLISHLAADHNFFEGSRSHRVDPVKLARILELDK
jgi:hypothetical protein